jgi:UDP-galactopyranose mutase
MKYDFLVVGSGVFGATFAYIANSNGKKVLVVEKRPSIGGNVYCEEIAGINVHKYGAHIFHTNNKMVWEFVQSFVEFNNYINAPIANYKGKLYNLPFNMNTFYALFGVTTPAEARNKIEQDTKKFCNAEPANLEEQAISLVGVTIYETLIKGYTEKQWGRECRDLPAFIIKRLPVRFRFDNNYFNDPYQGIPIGGYNKLINKLLSGIEVKTNTDFFSDRKYFESLAGQIVYTGKIDEYFDYQYGRLEYRSIRFEQAILDCENYQGNAVVNYTDAAVPYVRIIEHKHFEFGNQAKTVITKEYPQEWDIDKEPLYPINDKKNMDLYKKYYKRAKEEKDVLFGGRLAEYTYYDMDKVIKKAMDVSENIGLRLCDNFNRPCSLD